MLARVEKVTGCRHRVVYDNGVLIGGEGALACIKNWLEFDVIQSESERRYHRRILM